MPIHNLDIKQKDHRKTAGIWDALLLKDPTHQLDRAKNRPWNMWQTQNWKGSATKSHLEETPTVWPHMQDGGQQEVKDNDVQNCRRNKVKRQAM